MTRVNESVLTDLIHRKSTNEGKEPNVGTKEWRRDWGFLVKGLLDERGFRSPVLARIPYVR